MPHQAHATLQISRSLLVALVEQEVLECIVYRPSVPFAAWLELRDLPGPHGADAGLGLAHHLRLQLKMGLPEKVSQESAKAIQSEVQGKVQDWLQAMLTLSCSCSAGWSRWTGLVDTCVQKRRGLVGQRLQRGFHGSAKAFRLPGSCLPRCCSGDGIPDSSGTQSSGLGLGIRL